MLQFTLDGALTFAFGLRHDFPLFIVTVNGEYYVITERVYSLLERKRGALVAIIPPPTDEGLING